MAAPSDRGFPAGPLRQASLKRLAPLLLLLGLAAALLVPLLGRQGLSDPVESSLAESVREMRASGDWLIPRLYGEPAAERPPLMTWVMAGSFAIFGESETAARIPSVLAALALLGVVWKLAERLGAGAHGGWMAAVILASSLQFVLLGRSADPDVPFTLFFAAGILCLLQALHRPSPGAWGPAGAALLGVAVLFQGTVGLVLVALVAVPCALLAAGPRAAALRPLLSAASFLAVVLPWYAAVATRDPGLAARWLTPGNALDAARYGSGATPASTLTFGLMLLVGFLPWSLFLPGSVARAAVESRRGGPGERRLRIVPALWLLVMLTLFTLAAGRFSCSILPALPAAAILAAEPIATWLQPTSEARRLKGVGAVLLLVILTGGMVFFTTSGGAFGSIPSTFKTALLPICFAGLLGSLFTLSSLLLQRPRLAFLLLLGGSAILDFALLTYGFPTLEPWRSSRAAAQAVKPMIDAGDRVVLYRRYSPGFAYYLERIPERVGREDALRKILELPERVFCLMERDLFEQLRTRHPSTPLYLLSRSGAQVVVSNRSPAAAASR